MANFGKKAKLECQKSTVGVECIVSVYDTAYDEVTGEPVHYKVIVQRLQDQISVEDAEKGFADALPFITNKKQWYQDVEGNGHAVYTHYDYIKPEMMNAIIKASKNCYESVVIIEDADGMKEEKQIKNYCVRLNIGFNLAKGEAFFYRIKTGVNKDSLAKDIKYNMRHMPKEGRELTAQILEGHRNITDIAYRVYMDSLKLGQNKNMNGESDKDGSSENTNVQK